MDTPKVAVSEPRFTVRKGLWFTNVYLDEKWIQKHERHDVLDAIRVQCLPVPSDKLATLREIEKFLLSSWKRNPDLFDPKPPKPSTIQFNEGDEIVSSAVTIPSAISSAFSFAID